MFGRIHLCSHLALDFSFLEFLNTTKALVVKWASGDQDFKIAVSSQDKDS